MTLNQIQNKAHASLEILKSFLFYCRQASSQTYLFKLRTAPCAELTFKQLIFMDNTSPSDFTVSLKSHSRVSP